MIMDLMIIKTINSLLPYKKLGFIILESDDASFSKSFLLCLYMCTSLKLFVPIATSMNMMSSEHSWLVRMTVTEQVKREWLERFRLIGSLLNCGLHFIIFYIL